MNKVTKVGWLFILEQSVHLTISYFPLKYAKVL